MSVLATSTPVIVVRKKASEIAGIIGADKVRENDEYLQINLA